MANINQQEQERLRLLEEIEMAEKRINVQNEKIAVSKAKEAKRLTVHMQQEKKRVEQLKEELKVVEKIVSAENKRKETAKKRRELQEEAAQYEDDQLKSLTKLSPAIKSLLNEQVAKTGLVTDMTKRMIWLKRLENKVSADGKATKIKF